MVSRDIWIYDAKSSIVIGMRVKRNSRKVKRLRKRGSRKCRNKRQRGGAALKFGLMAIFKNESMGIREWVEHYLWQGVDTILLLDNNSTDDWKSKIQDYLDGGKVTVLPAPAKHAQNEHYNNIGMPWFKERKVDVLAILDLDEFMFCKDGKILRQYVEEIFGTPTRPSRIYCKWTMFGSSGLDRQPASVRKSFIWRKKDKSEVPNIKSISWIADIKDKGANLHQSYVTGRVEECPETIQLNHYAIQSKQYFEEVKMTRGAADSALHENVRTWEYFKRYDFHEEEDTKLKDLVEEFERASGASGV